MEKAVPGQLKFSGISRIPWAREVSPPLGLRDKTSTEGHVIQSPSDFWKDQSLCTLFSTRSLMTTLLMRLAKYKRLRVSSPDGGTLVRGGGNHLIGSHKL